MPVKHLNATFTEDEFERLSEEKGDRTWEEAILQEFGIDNE